MPRVGNAHQGDLKSVHLRTVGPRDGHGATVHSSPHPGGDSVEVQELAPGAAKCFGRHRSEATPDEARQSLATPAGLRLLGRSDLRDHLPSAIGCPHDTGSSRRRGAGHPGPPWEISVVRDQGREKATFGHLA